MACRKCLYTVYIINSSLYICLVCTANILQWINRSTIPEKKRPETDECVTGPRWTGHLDVLSDFVDKPEDRSGPNRKGTVKSLLSIHT